MSKPATLFLRCKEVYIGNSFSIQIFLQLSRELIGVPM